MKLVFYSGGALASNRVLHDQLVGLIGRKRQRSMTYIPFCARGSLPFYARFIRRYKPHGVEDFRYLALDQAFTRDKLEHALDADAIYLAGGNTFYFLHHLMRTGVLARLKSYVRDGGVLAGLSAGALIMTPHIGLAGFPPFAADRNTVGLKKLEALGLVGFEFFPHYSERQRLRLALEKYSRRSQHPLIATRDGGGIVVKDGRMELIGRSELFVSGLHGPVSI